MNYFVSSVEHALFALRSNKARTFLSLFGMSIGIFCIVTVMVAVDGLKESLNQGFENFGKDMVFIRQFPLEEEGNRQVKWWDYLRRPPVSLQDFNFLQKNCNCYGKISFVASFQKEVKNFGNSVKDAFVVGIAGDWKHLIGCDIEHGRGFSDAEIVNTGLYNGRKTAIIGASICARLFPNMDKSAVVGKTMDIEASRLVIIGVLVENGDNMVKIFDADNCVFIPVDVLQDIVPLENAATFISALPAQEISKDELICELAGTMRIGRRLKPAEMDDFSIGELSFVVSEIDKILGKINLAGVLIGLFSLLVGAFGIANIMFVSVKERTSQIGIYKALGAKRRVILHQFLAEAAILAAIGGAVGIALVWLLSLAIPSDGMIVFKVSWLRAVTGLAVASVVGLIAGLAPALSASRLDPVTAINSI